MTLSTSEQLVRERERESERERERERESWLFCFNGVQGISEPVFYGDSVGK